MHVEKELNAVSGVTEAIVDLEKEEAVIESEAHIPLEILQKALEEGGGGYRIMSPADKKKAQ